MGGLGGWVHFLRRADPADPDRYPQYPQTGTCRIVALVLEFSSDIDIELPVVPGALVHQLRCTCVEWPYIVHSHSCMRDSAGGRRIIYVGRTLNPRP